MKLRLVVFPLVCFCSVLGPLQGASTNDSPEFTEVYELLRHHLAGIDETELSKAAVSGLLKQLRPRVALVGESTESAVSTNTEATLRTVAFDGAYGYIRIGQIGWQTDKQVVAACQQLTASNRLKGFVLDLRFAGGEDYAAATRLADMFFSKEKPLLDYGQGMKNSTEKTNALALPLTILVNRQTTGAAEAFAGVLRQADVGLLLGTNTAGKAMMGKEFPLKSGQRLWIATSLVKLGNGKIFPSGGLRPDIQVEVSPEDEEAYFEDAYRVLPKPGQSAVATSVNQASLAVTNRFPRRRTTEADLVRMHRDGELPPDFEPPQAKSRENENPPHLIYDPVLARAIDLLKGLSLVQQFRTS